jgi:hypothetical protein
LWRSALCVEASRDGRADLAGDSGSTGATPSPMSSNTLPERGDQGAQPAAIPPLVAHIALLYFPKFA